MRIYELLQNRNLDEISKNNLADAEFRSIITNFDEEYNRMRKFLPTLVKIRNNNLIQQVKNGKNN